MDKIKPVIIAGGNGTRLWPMSRSKFPKQFLSLCGEHSMLQQTVLRMSGLHSTAPTLICNEDHRFIAAEQMRQIDCTNASILLEPFGRNTAPAIALAAFQALNSDNDAVLLVLAADHVIGDVAEFHRAIQIAHQQVLAGKLVTFGITPAYPETGYGYIRKGQSTSADVFVVDAFVEKPNAATAEQYVNSGEYLWNSGMFMFTATTYLAELKKFRPDIYDACQNAWLKQTTDEDFIRIGKEEFALCPDDSIDWAVMERTSSGVVVPLDAKWNDVGGFAALWEVSPKDATGNAIN